MFFFEFENKWNKKNGKIKVKRKKNEETEQNSSWKKKHNYAFFLNEGCASRKGKRAHYVSTSSTICVSTRSIIVFQKRKSITYASMQSTTMLPEKQKSGVYFVRSITMLPKNKEAQMCFPRKRWKAQLCFRVSFFRFVFCRSFPCFCFLFYFNFFWIFYQGI